MFNPVDIIDFFEILDSELDSISIEENNNGNNVTLDKIKKSNSGNNCLHYNLICNNHRIVIQTYKELSRKGDVDIVQGKPELEPIFEDIIKIMNNYSDETLNKLFVFYCGLWSKCISFDRIEMDSFICKFNSNTSITWCDKWLINANNATELEIQIIFDFIAAMEDICQ